ncbi:adhesin [Exiguobacterium sp. SH3S2]|uniref:HesB/YadR/YfhF family protein n=2 Tax=Bacillales Family XII. Incertae Sedis TaxID=539742 RepID=UPI0003529D8D|nr:MULTISPECIES: iron-sulfur cluster biosynthesis family protein [Exiguobacterium]EPE63373.1 iron-sulfur cluster biosynthesis family protein [Exiguobacterium sp. S17]OGX78881.1 adhesin [Exiguobacterium sp. SH31]TCI34547.1 adhesin [Exiguobacterium sp. SH4S7]TCI44299.1 adhesin [Exiguobacterium sp. SH5S32]TCI47269.1 adhesin [Exiguobacterium sp. SH3S3]
MKINVTEEALQFFKDEMEVEAGQTVRLFAKYGGSTDLTHGFSVGVITEEIDNAVVETNADGIRFVVAEQDEWLFQGQDVNVEIRGDEVVFVQAD